jgi:hypothetical protein
MEGGEFSMLNPAEYKYISTIERQQQHATMPSLPERLVSLIDYFRKYPTCGLAHTGMKKMFDASGMIHESLRDWLGSSMPVGYAFPCFGRHCFARALFFAGETDYQMWLRVARRFEFSCVDKRS